MFGFLNKLRNKKDHEAIFATVLVIEDNEVERTLINRILTKKNYKVLIAKDGETGLNLAFQNNVDLILLDYHMPGKNGIEVCGILKNDPRTKRIPIIFLTTLEGSDIIHFYEAGADNYLHKLINPKLLLNEVRLTIEEYRNKK